MSPRERGVCFYAVFGRLARSGRSISSRRRGPLVWVKQAATAPPQHPIHGLRDANGQSLKPARKHAAIDRLHEQVQMVALHREVQYAQAAARGLRQSASDGGEEWLRA